MARYHFSAKVLSRSSRNTVGALAYRAGCKLYDEKTAREFIQDQICARGMAAQLNFHFDVDERSL